MLMRRKKILMLFATSLFLIPSCSNTSSEQSYDGRTYDISEAQDGSLIATTVKFDRNYDLSIEGSGFSIDYASKNEVPWNPIARWINHVEISNGINNIGDYMFYSINVEYIILPKSVYAVGDHSFNENTIIYTYGETISNIDNEVYYYREDRPVTGDNYFHLDENGFPQIWVPSGEVNPGGSDDEPAKPLSFLFIGNSFTYRGPEGGADGSLGTITNPAVPYYFKKIGESLGLNINIDYVVKGSHSLTKFSNPNDEMGSIVENKLTTKDDYDYVILQEQSTTPINNYNNFLNAATKLKARIDETQKECSTILYETWGSPTAIEGTKFNTVAEMEDELKTAYTNAGKALNCKVNYIGSAFTYTYEQHNTINIYASDNRHQNEFGAYLSAACHIRSLFNKKVSASTEYCGLDQNKCKTLLSVADKIC